ncbi:MAG: thioredoxin family protein [bacterium]|nr:thioredoxin family protein [bacterium]
MSRSSGSERGHTRRVPTFLFVHALAAAALVLVGASAGAAAVATVAPADDAEASPPPVAWFGLREGKIEARQRDRPLLVYFTASWSTPAMRIEREVWTDRRLRRYVAEHLVAARVDFQESPSVARHFGIMEPPALLVISPQGESLVVLRGNHGADSYLRVATYAGSRAWEHTDYATWLSRRGNR